jgi:ribosomal protein S27E
MFPVTCRNCGELNLFLAPPPQRVKCESCGNSFRTDLGPGSPSPRRRGKRKSRRSADLDFGMVRDRLGEMYPVLCDHCGRVNLILSAPPAQVTCDHCHQPFSAYEEADIEVEEAFEQWKGHKGPGKVESSSSAAPAPEKPVPPMPSPSASTTTGPASTPATGAGKGCLKFLGALVAAAAGSGLGIVALHVGDFLGGGWVRLALAAGVLWLGVALVVSALVRLRSDFSGLLIGLACGPLLGALVGGALWEYGPQLPFQLPTNELAAFGIPHTWEGFMIASAAAGLLVVTYLDRRHPVFAGAAFGLIPGFLLGRLGGWSTEVWFISPVIGALLATLLFRAGVLACLVRLRTSEHRQMFAGAMIAGAVVGTLLCGLGVPLADWLAGVEMWAWLKGLLLSVLGLPSAAANLLGQHAGWLGGAVAGAMLGAIIPTYGAPKYEDAGTLPPVELLFGAVLGGVDWFLDGRLLAGLFGTWAAGASSGAVVGAFSFLAAQSVSKESDQSPRDSATAGLLVLALVMGGGAAGLLWWLGPRLEIPAAAGGLFGLIAGLVYLNQEA